ncbi:MAG TPA: PEP-CTERM sorting domain-containing protein [Candidatus Kapabacteria bacterium]|nr:PEP-CTERM sorting domain-containing protein [Candidatus Kapabacteria bacterium]
MIRLKNPLSIRAAKRNVLSTTMSLASVWVVTVSALPADAAPVIDQSVIYPASGGISSYSIYETPTNQYVLAQTFTAGMSGQLTAVNLGLFDKAIENLTINILGTSGGLPNLTAPLMSGTLTPSGVDNDPFSLETVDFSSYLFDVVAGEMYAIMLSSTTPFQQEYNWTRGSFDTFTGDDLSPADPYAGGVGYYSNNGGSTWNALTDFSQDFSFQTIVDPNPVPEPGSIGFMLAGLAVYRFLSSRRRVKV